MKPFILSFLTILLLSSHLQAQVPIAVKAGAGFSSLKFKRGDPYQGRIGWYAGAAAHVNISDQFFFQPELLYSLRGYHQRPGNLGNPGGNVGFSYLSVPLLAGYQPAKNLSILLGPEPGYMLSAKARFNGNTTTITDFVRYRFSIDATAGAAWALTPKLTIEARFVMQLNTIYRVIYTDENGNELGTGNDGRNRVAQVGIAYTL